MLRHCVKASESDRFIAARSTEREVMIDRYKIKDKVNSLEEVEAKTFCNSAEPKTRTPVIIRDQKQIRDKLYLSLLKTQLFKKKSTEENKREGNLSNKKRRRMYTLNSVNTPVKEECNIHTIKSSDENVEENVYNGISGTPHQERNDLSSVNTPRYDFNTRTNFNNNSAVKFAKKLNFHNCKSESIFHKKRRLDIDNLEFNSGVSFKDSFKDLVDFDISKEDSVNYKLLNQKNISASAYKVLDAPKLRDDFYLHLLDWSNTDILAVGLENSVYLWESKTTSVGLVKNYEDDKVTAVGWMDNGTNLLVGLNSGKIHIWDINKSACVKTYEDHSDRVGIFATVPHSPSLFSSGSLDQNIFNFDLRAKEKSSKFHGHTQEVCGLQWSKDGKMLASGGNDNKLMLWTLRKETPEKKFTAHQSAVKAIGWSHHKLGLLASGGGTQDRTIKLWNTNTMTQIESIDTTSQVCNIAFSKITNEFVTTHGYSDNLILVWDFEKLEVIATLKGHRDRVIYMSTSPEGGRIVTGAGDETIRFWHVFKEEENPNKKSLQLQKFKIR